MRWLDWLIPDEIASQGPEALLRARATLAFCAVGIGAALYFIPSQIRQGALGLVAASIGITMLVLCVPLVMRFTGSLCATGHVGTFVLVLYMTVLIGATGGRAHGTLVVVALIPILAVFLAGRRAAVVWSLLTCAVLGVVAAGVQRDHVFPIQLDHKLQEVLQFHAAILVVAVVLGLALLHDSLRSRADRQRVEALRRAERSEALLAANERRFRSLIEQSLQGLVVFQGERLVFANQTLLRRIGISFDELASGGGEKTWDSIHPDDRDRVVSSVGKYLDTGELVEHQEFRVVPEDGKVRWVESLWSQIEYQGKPALQVAFYNITARKEAEEELTRYREQLEDLVAQRTRELEASQERLRRSERLASVGTLAAGVAHQINNPVGSILAAADYALICEEDTDAKETWKRSLEDIRREAKRCGEVVRSILQFSRAGDSHKLPQDANQVISSARDETFGWAADRSACVELELDPAVASHPVPMNAIEMEQVLVNLIHNAIESRPEGVRVTLASEYADGEIRIRVSDDGPGIEPGDIGRIFDPFFTTRLEKGGTGLGLSVAHRIIGDHAGSISAENRPGGGASFRIVLPT
jgi:PAS domain S-box-containing protein